MSPRQNRFFLFRLLFVGSVTLCLLSEGAVGQWTPIQQGPPCLPAPRPFYPGGDPNCPPHLRPNFAPVVPGGRTPAPGQPAPRAPGDPRTPGTPGAPRTPGDSQAPVVDRPGSTPSSPDASAAAAPAPSNAPQRSVGGTYGGFASVANQLGDNFGGGGGCSISILPVPLAQNMFIARGFIVGGTPDGDPNASLVFETTGGPANDFFSQGAGVDTNGDGRVDTFMVAEPTQPTDAPISTEPGAIYLGGAAFNPATANGEYQTGQDWDINYRFAAPREVKFSTSGGGALVGRQKIAENNSPIPRDRIFFNYSGFKNVPLAAGGVTVNRYTVGFEKTFLNQGASLELRVPLGSTLSSDLRLGEGVDSSHGEMGDIMLSLKMLLLTVRSSAFTAGVAFTVPTGDDTRVFLRSDWEFVRIRNESVHLMPYLGFANVAADNRLFFSSFLQLDVDINGNKLLTNFDNTQLRGVGQLQDPTLLYADASLGYWLLHPSQRSDRFLKGFAPIAEAHYNTNLSATDFFRAGEYRIGQPKPDNVETVNAVVGAVASLRGGTTVSAGYATPIGNHTDALFDGELRIFANKNF